MPRFLHLLLLLTLCSLLACKDETASLRIGSNRWPGYAPLYLADERGALQQARVQLIEYPHTTGVIRAFENGLLDGALLTLDEALRLAAEGIDLQLLLVADVSAGADALYAAPHIRTLQDLRGQRIGVENTALGGYFLSRILDEAGLSEQQISTVNLPVNEHARALREGRVDAVVSFATEEAAMHASNARRLFDSHALPNAIIDVLVVARQRTSPADQQRLQQLWQHNLDWLQANRPEALAILERRLGISQQELELTFSQLLLGDAGLNRQLQRDGLLQAQLLLLENYLLERGLILRRPANPLLGECRGPAC